MDPKVATEFETDTREALMKIGKQRQALAVPLAASEWNAQSTQSSMEVGDDNQLVLTASGSKRLYAPLWFDFQRRRFKRKRTWRQLTIADQLRIVGHDEAAAFRVQQGSEQWVVYRSLKDRVCRSFLGKHIVADFFVSRFDPEDGDHEALITVDDSEHH